MKRALVWIAAGCLLLSGCGNASAEHPDASQTPLVYVDWSQLDALNETSPGPQYTYFAPYSGSGPLQPREDYGTLLPYIGADLSVNNYICDQLPAYGLATKDGKLVTEPVYADIQYTGAFLLLYRGTQALYRSYQNGESQEPRGSFHITVAAQNGSWVREFESGSFLRADDHLLALADTEALRFIDTEGNTAASFSNQLFQPYFHPESFWGNEGGPWLIDFSDGIAYVLSYNDGTEDDPLRLYLDLSTEQVLEQPPAGYPIEPDFDVWQDPPKLDGYRYLSEISDPVTHVSYYLGNRADGYLDLLDEDYQVLVEGLEQNWFDEQDVIGGCLLTWENAMSPDKQQWSVFRDLLTGEETFRFPLRTNSD